MSGQVSFSNITQHLGDRNRIKKYNIFLRNFKPDASTKILDVGASEKEYRTEANILEKLYPYPENITVLGVDPYEQFYIRYPQVKTVTYNGKDFPFKDERFDVCWCNAVLEHVGDRNAQRFFLSEIKRVARRGFIATPDKYFPLELHTKIPLLHYFPKRIFDKILKLFHKQWATGDYMHLLSFNDLKKLLEESGINQYRIVRNKILGFTVNFIVIF